MSTQVMERVNGPVPEMAREEILLRLNDPSLAIVCALTKVDFESGHIPRSVSLPVPDVKDKARALFPDLNQQMVIYCGGFL